jgi:hypothetical protein
MWDFNWDIFLGLLACGAAFTDVEIPPLACNQICSKFLAGYSGGFLNSHSPRDRHYLHGMTIQSGISSARGLPEDRM